MSGRTGVTRREFLRSAGEFGGALVITFHLPPRGASAAVQTQAALTPNGWLRIAHDGTVTLTLDKSELGQGTHTALAMIVADELEADWSKVRIGPMPENPAGWSRGMTTGGSTGVYTSYEILRKAGATGRAMLTSAAAATWQVDPSTCRAERGSVIHAPSRRRLTYGALVARAATLPVPAEAPLKDPRDFRLIGTRQHRLEAPSKVDGSAVFGLDVKVPGMLVASIERCPVFGGSLARFNADRARAMPGVHHVVPLEGISWKGIRGAWGVGRAAGVAVVADSYWQAVQARRALDVEWDAGAAATLDSNGIRAELVRLSTGPAVRVRRDGDPSAAFATAAQRLDAEYETPFLAHMPMEPMNCTAHVRADEADVWVPTQNQTRAQQVAAEVAGLPVERVHLHSMYSGGGFGRRLESDFVAEAVALSKAAGAPVKVVWTREDDIQHDFYRPVTYNRLSASLDASGRPVAWTHRIVAPSIDVKFGPLQNGIDESLLTGARELPYAIANVQVDLVAVDLPIPLGYWRSVGLTHNTFVTECFFDEVAAAAHQDPFELRRSLLAGKPRHLRALELAAERAGWGSPLPAGHARGIALCEWEPTTCAEVAEVSVAADGTVKVHRVVCAVDCGQAVNLAGLEAQMQGGVLFGLQAALYGRITLEGGRVEQGNFQDYRVLQMAEAPVVEVHVVPSSDRQGGIGEPPVGPIAPAVCNAIFAATGRRIRSLPIVPAP
jgi:isoquinoline 1-oxidoreductase beta subunit